MSIRSVVVGVVGVVGFLGAIHTVVQASTPRQPPGSWKFGPETVWTNGSTSNLFQPLSDPMPSAYIVQGRISMEITESTSNNLRTRPALRYSSDGVGWDTSAAIDTTYVAGDGTQAGTTFVDLTTVATPKAWIQFGVEVKNNTAGDYELGHVVMIVEPKGN